MGQESESRPAGRGRLLDSSTLLRKGPSVLAMGIKKVDGLGDSGQPAHGGFAVGGIAALSPHNYAIERS